MPCKNPYRYRLELCGTVGSFNKMHGVYPIVLRGRLRPHFFDVCKPDRSLINCTDQYGYPRYVTEDVCTVRADDNARYMYMVYSVGCWLNKTARTVIYCNTEIPSTAFKSDIVHFDRLSFPSGHACLTTYAAVFIMVIFPRSTCGHYVLFISPL